MRSLQSCGDLPANIDCLTDRETAAFQSGGERFTFDEFQNKKSRAVDLVQIMNRRNIGMIQRREGDSFALKSGDLVGITAEFAGEDLDGDVAPQLSVAGAVHIAHPAGTEVHLQ
jgi:hypothetical protein